ncbi:MAG: DUF2520 domain-containing protein [Chitinophagaceae bacterium]|jgi:predicted short-subunit dehydrogenase-like oxidoreductase (DUF2520 family)|nr:DUF2520 domain-containing protein [Chitinophagaceae bacterium]OQY95358.1 MAG: hypothetical protein B6D37_05955 [Sphingobacteriales bacterium UTBCD1]
MDIIIIGTGNASAVLGRKLKNAGHHIVQIFGRNASAASKLAYELGTESTSYWSVIKKDADLYLVAVSDEAIPDVARHLHVPGKIVVHTAASVSKDVLKKTSHHYGVFYPLQSLRKERKGNPVIPIFVDASDEKTKKILENLAHSVSGEQVSLANDDTRIKLHIAAVVAGNFTNFLYAVVEDYCNKENLDFKQLIPLIEETAERVKTVSPRQSQTGPAVRHDTETIQKHLDLLKGHPQLKKLYAFMTEAIQSLV